MGAGHTTGSTTGFGADLALVRSALRGSPEAVREFTERMRCVPRMLAAKNARIGQALRPEELEDLVQDTLVSIWRRLDSFAGRASLETWAYSFCHHELANRLRSKQRRPQGPELREEEAPTKVAKVLEYDHVYRAIDRLGGEEADIVRLKHFEELTFDGIGARLEISPNTAKTRYYRALGRLRELLAPQMEEVSR